MAKIPVSKTPVKSATAGAKTASPRPRKAVASKATAAKTTAAKTATVKAAVSKTPTGSGTSAVEAAGASLASNPVFAADLIQVELRKKELIEAAVDRSGIKKRFAKPAIEAALAILGEALDEKRTLNLPPMGKVKIQRAKEIEGGWVLAARIRRKTVNEVAGASGPVDGGGSGHDFDSDVL